MSHTIRVVILTTAYNRLRTTLQQLQWMSSFQRDMKTIGMDVQPVYVLSSYDKHADHFKEDISRRGFFCTTTAQEKLSTKSQDGLDSIREHFSFDYLMHLDSDQILSMEMMKTWRLHMEAKVKWIGCRDQIFYQPEEKKAYRMAGYKRMKYVNGGHTIHRDVIELCGWRLWTKGLEFGLNVNEYKFLSGTGHQVKVKEMGIHAPVEIKRKSERNIHSMDWYRKQNYNIHELQGEDLTDFFESHGNLKRFFQ